MEYRHKQVIVVRKDLNMRRGKESAQVAHASLGAAIKLHKNHGASKVDLDKPTAEWLNSGMAKIVVSCDSLEELLQLTKLAAAAKLNHYLVKDAGHTEFNEPTYTCVCIGPELESKIDPITSHLKLR